MQEIQEISNKIDSYLNFIDTINLVEDKSINQLEELEDYNQNISQYIKDLTSALEYYKQGVDIVYQKTIKNLENQLTELLQDVFIGCDYSVNFEIEDLRGVKNLIIEFANDTFKGDPDDCGGSLTTVVGYLFHLMYLIKSGRPRILIMDELFRDLNNEYLINLIELINKLTKEMGFINILITHVEEIQHLSDNIYTVQDGNYEFNAG